MQSKIKLLVSLVIILLVVAALTFTLYKPAQTGKPVPVPKIWGYVTYDKGCSFTNHDTVWLENGIREFTLVYWDGSNYKYEFCPPSGPEGDRELYGYQGSGGCVTPLYELYWELEDIQQDIEFVQVP